MSKYQDAVKCLRSRLRPLHSNPAKNVPNNLNMKEWLSELGCEDPDLLNVIHITGTKGKGGTAAYTDSFIRAHCRNASQPIKVGLYTSPHLVTERERIRINSQPISENLFAVTFFRVWDTLCRNYSIERMPGYLQLLALQSVLVFQLEQVDVAIYEVHAGGRKDATNIFDRPVVCGFTTVGLDHADLLGNSIDSIAEHKSGIMKRGRPAYSVFQREQAAKKVLTKEASRLGCPLTFVEVDARVLDLPNLRTFAQRQNASLAIQLANSYLETRGEELAEGDIVEGSISYKWPGRFERVPMGNTTWFLDCAHNALSIPVALSWFGSEVRSVVPRSSRHVLIFGHESARSTFELISLIAKFCSEQKLRFDLVILSPYERYGQKIHGQTVAKEHATFWKTVQPSTRLACATSLEQAMTMAEDDCGGVLPQVLITGSVYLVGQAITLLDKMHDRGC
ncbi:hypothetical protein ACCO45_010057 [Purpureocillium lilacinum]|uniref:Uncharacterized protein n=1 Tax=Purpureocillium lilacinum TaxID=33203 RepID=A0ACC4DFV7_PURLI